MVVRLANQFTALVVKKFFERGVGLKVIKIARALY
jgi:hypothetical protein